MYIFRYVIRIVILVLTTIAIYGLVLSSPIYDLALPISILMFCGLLYILNEKINNDNLSFWRNKYHNMYKEYSMIQNKFVYVNSDNLRLKHKIQELKQHKKDTNKELDTKNI